MRVTVTGGGTGGHISPALAIVDELRRRDRALLLQWIGRGGGMEERIAKDQGIPFRPVPIAGWPRQRSPKMLLVGSKLVLSVLRSAMYLRAFRPDLVIGVGGYVCLPALIAAQRLNIPTIIHEQNKRLGLANRIAAPKSDALFLSYPDTIGQYPKERAFVVGNPVRSGFINPPAREEAREKFGLRPHLPTVLVVGGSQGARSINDAVRGMLPELGHDEMQIVWMTGQEGANAARAAAADAPVPVQVHPFILDMPAACAAADVIVSRAGASSTAEIAAIGKPSILIPYPHATDNHQEDNARAFDEAGAARLLLDSKCTAEALLRLVREVLADEHLRKRMSAAALGLAKPLAAEVIAEHILEMLFEDGEEVGA